MIQTEPGKCCLQIGCPAADNLAGEFGNSGQEQANQPLRADSCSPRWSSPRCQELLDMSWEFSSNQKRIISQQFSIFIATQIQWGKRRVRCHLKNQRKIWFSTSQSTFIMNIFQKYCSFNCVISTMLGCKYDNFCRGLGKLNWGASPEEAAGAVGGPECWRAWHRVDACACCADPCGKGFKRSWRGAREMGCLSDYEGGITKDMGPPNLHF